MSGYMSVAGMNRNFGHYRKEVHIGIGQFKTPAAGAPAIATQDNTTMLSFAQNDTESIFLTWKVPEDYAGGDLTVEIHWTNDSGVDDEGKNVRWELNYQTVALALGSIAGDHANSPKVVNDTYTSATGHLFHTADMATVAAADFAGDHQVQFRLTAIAPAAVAMTGEAQFLEMMISYDAWRMVI